MTGGMSAIVCETAKAMDERDVKLCRTGVLLQVQGLEYSTSKKLGVLLELVCQTQYNVLVR
jgi:hypothetical protein